MSQTNPAPAQRRRNGALWAGTAFLFLTILSNLPPLYAMQGFDRVLAWASLAFPAIALVFFAVGLKRAFTMREVYGGRTFGSILGVVSLLLVAGSVWLFAHVRDVPRSSGAPQVGQKAPDFTLTDSDGNQVSLAQMLSAPAGAATHPKAVLLFFYRGYW